mgnify:CR=1 FL=1
MAKILCAYSGIEFSCEHFPITLHARESYHPIFNVPQKKLLSYLGKWAGNELTPTDNSTPPQHAPRATDVNPVSEKRAEQQIAILFALSGVGSLLLIYSYI